MKLRLFMILFLPSSLWALIGGQCNTAPSPYLCAASPPAPTPCDMWIGASYSVYEVCGAPGACVPDLSSPTNYSQATPTNLVTFQMASPCGCSFGQCSCGANVVATGACTGSCVQPCPPPPPPPPVCGDGICDVGENCTTCPRDCGVCPPPPPVCGDGVCNGAETCGTCAADCGACCVPVPGVCNGASPACGVNGPGLDTCGNACVIPGPPCCTAPGDYCGKVTAIENPAVVLRGMALSLHEARGALVQYTNTQADGTYRFTPPGPGYFYIAAEMNRNQSAAPISRGPYGTPQKIGDISFRGVPSTLKVLGVANTFVLVTPDVYPQAKLSPPKFIAGGSVQEYSAALDVSGDYTINLPSRGPGGGAYWLTCWVPTRCGNQVKYLRDNNQQVNAGNSFDPQIALPDMACGHPVCP
jgi:hypothetical protein